MASIEQPGRARPGPGCWRALVAICVFAGLFAATVGEANAARKAPAGFGAFIESVWPDAQARGVSRATFDAAFRGVAFDSKVIARTKAQAELVKPIWQYLSSAVSAERVERATATAAKHESWLSRARKEYGVDPSAIVGIWGLETDFGAYAGSDSIIQSLATLAFAHYRGNYFRDELLAALAILQEGDIAPGQMRGSWAGAMGQTQFMPSSFNDYAVDFDGDGRRDIWTSAPDAIGSTANYLAKHGWKAGLPWGLEVVMPKDFALAAEDTVRMSPISAWSARGVRRVDGGALPPSGEAKLLLAGGVKGPAFLVTPNFAVIKTYNNSTSYALGVALLGDRAYGAGPLRGAWPVHDRQLSQPQTREMQTILHKLGYDVGEIDGHMGEHGRAALGAWEQKVGLTPDGYPSPEALGRLRKQR
jgi:membrane-bound lytic murein transglycosylase B